LISVVTIFRSSLALACRASFFSRAYDCAQAGHAFAAGVLVLACVDALARMQTGIIAVKKRYLAFARSCLQSFATGDLAERLYEDFRNGLIHEGRIKAGAQFSLEIPDTVMTLEQIMVVNPVRLADEVSSALTAFISTLQHDTKAREKLSLSLIEDHGVAVGKGK